MDLEGPAIILEEVSIGTDLMVLEVPVIIREVIIIDLEVHITDLEVDLDIVEKEVLSLNGGLPIQLRNLTITIMEVNTLLKRNPNI